MVGIWGRQVFYYGDLMQGIFWTLLGVLGGGWGELEGALGEKAWESIQKH